MAKVRYDLNVFINCPFDDDYAPTFDALIFSIFDCGFIPRWALEISDSSQIRIEKIQNIIAESKYSVHDISRTELDIDTNLPRFNMPLELGLFLGAKRFGTGEHNNKACLIMHTERYLYQKFISDIRVHNGQAETAVGLIRGWLNSTSNLRTIPGGQRIWSRYTQYRNERPEICAKAHVTEQELTFNDKANFASLWLQENG